MSLASTVGSSAIGALVLSFFFYYVVLGFLLRRLGSHLLRRTAAKREVILRKLGAGGDGKIVGFFHPYWYVWGNSGQ